MPGGTGMGATLGRAAVGGLAGGIGSMAAGGSFRDGAMSGAISSLVSEAAQRGAEEINDRRQQGIASRQLASASDVLGQISDAGSGVLQTMSEWGGRAGFSASPGDGFSASLNSDGISVKTPIGKWEYSWSGGDTLENGHQVQMYGEKIRLGVSMGFSVDPGTFLNQAASQATGAVIGSQVGQTILHGEAERMRQIREATQ